MRKAIINSRLPPDTFSAVLQDLRLSAAHYCQCEVSEPWGINLPAKREAMVHFILSGQCWLQLSSENPTRLYAGDIVILSHGTGHRLFSTPEAETRSIESLAPQMLGDRTFRLRTGGRGPITRLVCCGISFEEPAINPLLELMPPVLLVREEAERNQTLRLLLQAMAQEFKAQRIGAATVITRLADTLVTQVLRSWIEANEEITGGWLAALRDPQIGKALAAFHTNPASDWNVVSLAAVANMSRSVFSEHFRLVVGMSPARYMTRWRIHLAATLLKTDRLTVAEIAFRVGYSSEATFSRTFKRLNGTSPTAFRGKAASIEKLTRELESTIDEHRRVQDEKSPARATRV
jgi:AraC-like DNA-binding protein